MARRRFGTGSITHWDGFWWAVVRLADHRVRRRRRASRAEAVVALAELIEQHRDELGYYYQARLGGPRRPELRHQRSRAGMTPRRRWRVLERDGFRCVYCGATPADARLVVDHVQPVADGGTDEDDNLATACVDCNAGKSDRPLLSTPAVIAARNHPA